MVTGDNQVTAGAVAADLGIERGEAEVLPDHKADVVNRLHVEGRVVAFAGDGVNDAPTLAAADVGLALALAFGYNTAGIPIAAGVLLPALGWLLSPMVAVSVIVNVLRLRTQRLG